MFRRENKKAQSTLEYIIVLSAIVGVILYAAANWIKPAVEASLNNANTAIGKAAGKL